MKADEVTGIYYLHLALHVRDQIKDTVRVSNYVFNPQKRRMNKYQ